jgi:hypothetical protein
MMQVRHPAASGRKCQGIKERHCTAQPLLLNLCGGSEKLKGRMGDW